MRFTQLLKRFAREADGNVILTFSLAFPVLLGAAGLAVDSASFYDQQSRMQTVTDASALAVAKELHLYRKNLDGLKEVGGVRVETLLAEAGISHNPHTVQISINPATNVVEVSLSMVTGSFLPAEIWGENPIRVMSQAHAYGQNRLCVLALHPSKSDTIKADDGAQMSAPECAVQSNSKDPSGLTVKDGSKIISSVICTSGGAKGGSSAFEPAPQTDCPPLDDPLASRDPPAVGGCDYLDRKITGGKVSISPGVYCGGLKIDNSAEVTAEPGIYTMMLGKLEVAGKAKLFGDYVSFYFHDDAARLEFSPNTTVDLSAPKDGPMAGILFYENRKMVFGRDFTIKSENAKRLLGTIYLPRGTLKIEAKGSVAAESAYTVIVAQRLDVKEANLVVNSDYGGTDVPVPEGVGPHSSMVAIKQ
jgi:hypothetical protein